jgi:hypothetical protein
MVLWLLFQCAWWIGFGLRARKAGYVVYPSEEDEYREAIWVRRGETWVHWLLRGERKELVIDEGSTRETARSWWAPWNGHEGRANGFQSTERRPLLNGNGTPSH